MVHFDIQAKTEYDGDNDGVQFGQYSMVKTDCSPIFAFLKSNDLEIEQESESG